MFEDPAELAGFAIGSEHPRQSHERGQDWGQQVQGVYQTGEVYARSWVVISATAGSVIPNRLAS